MATSSNTPYYQMPPEWELDDTKLGWLLSETRSGETYLESQRGYADLDNAIDLISGFNRADEDLASYRSDARISEVKLTCQKVVAMLTDLRVIGNYKTFDPARWQAQCDMLNKLFVSWYLSEMVDRSVKEALMYAAVMGSGYLGIRWARQDWGFGRGEVVLDAYGPRDVIPIQMGRHHDIQQAYGMVIRVETPINEAIAMYPEFRAKLTPDRATPTGLRFAPGKLSKFLSPVLKKFGPGQKKEDDAGPTPVVDLFYAYIQDTSLNTTDKPIHMGAADTGWDYEVPFLGQDIPLDTPGTFRKAGPDDCRLYPRRRLIVFTQKTIISDGPSPWWHGKVPLIKFDLDKWPWEYLGYSLARNNANLEKNANKMLRGFIDSISLKIKPPHVIDDNAMSESSVDRWDISEPGAELRMNLLLNPDGVKFPIPPGQYDIPAAGPEVLKGLIERIAKQAGAMDLESLAKAKQIPSGDSVEKIVESIGPLARDYSRSLERPMRDLGEFFMTLVFQFYTVARRIQVLGPDGVSEEDYDFDPATLIPADTPGKSRTERAMWHMMNFRFHVTPLSLHQINQVTRKLLMLQLYKLNPQMRLIDRWSLADMFDIPNYGAPPEGTNSVMERVVAERAMEMEAMAELQQMMQGGGAPGGAGGQRGRPPENRKSPQLAQKGGAEGPRAVVKTS